MLYNKSQRGIAPLIILLIVALAAAGGGGVYVTRKNIVKRAEKAAMEKKAMDEAAMKEDRSRRAEKMVVELHAQNDSGETGSATIENSEGRAKVILRVQNTPLGVAQPAHIHTGSCATLGGVVYPLTNVINSTSETTLSVSVGQLVSAMAQGGLAMNVHKSGPEIATYVACGDLMPPANMEEGLKEGIFGSPKIKSSSGDEPGTLKREALSADLYAACLAKCRDTYGGSGSSGYDACVRACGAGGAAVPAVSSSLKTETKAEADASLETDVADLDAAIKAESKASGQDVGAMGNEVGQ